jgi:hypothetical protein
VFKTIVIEGETHDSANKYSAARNAIEIQKLF